MGRWPVIASEIEICKLRMGTTYHETEVGPFVEEVAVDIDAVWLA